MKKLLALAFVIGFTACKSDNAPVAPPVQSDSIVVAFPSGALTVKIAATATARDNGLMNVTSLGANSGMLFAFSGDILSPPTGFFMMNTPIPLSIAFLDASKVVINIDEMLAQTTNIHFASRPFRYAIEANKGWMTAHGVQAGTTVSFALPAGTVVDP